MHNNDDKKMNNDKEKDDFNDANKKRDNLINVSQKFDENQSNNPDLESIQDCEDDKDYEFQKNHQDEAANDNSSNKQDLYDIVGDENQKKINDFNKKLLEKYEEKPLDMNSEYYNTDNNEIFSQKENNLYESQDISFEQNFSQDTSNNNSNIKLAIDNEKEIIDILKENKNNNFSQISREIAQIKKSNTIGEVSNENASSFSNSQANNSLNKPFLDEKIFDTIDRSGKNLDSLDFIMIAYKYIQQIHHINYSFNRIKVIDNSLFSLGFVMTIDLRNNEIYKIQNLENCVNLRYLNLAHNKIPILEGLYNLHQLEFLDLSFNKITISDIIVKKLKFNKSLKSINLEGNVNYNFNELKIKILENVESICILDKKEIFKHKAPVKALSVSDFKLFFRSGDKLDFYDKPHNLRKIKDYIKFKKYFFKEEDKNVKKNY